MKLRQYFILFVVLVLAGGCVSNQEATIKESEEEIKTYPFSDPDPVPILIRSSLWGKGARLYPYSFFDEFTTEPEQRTWKKVRMENPYIYVDVLPEVGGKVWGAVDKQTGLEFIYKNHVLKFREVALRGPWTSGGIEFNFGIIGHSPAGAHPVNYLKRKNPDGSVSCIIGTMDLPSRTFWRVEIRVPPKGAYFETNSFWYNSSPLNQSYYAWSNAAVRVSEDLQYVFPGSYHIAHNYSEPLESWPLDSQGRDLSWYKNNDFGGYKSYFTVGEYEEYFGGYWHEDEFGFGHWAYYDDMPGHKIWIWGLSRQGMIWEGLLTDEDGQYSEPQAGRFLNQNDHGFFSPYQSDQWREIWFPYQNIGPMDEASSIGALNVDWKDEDMEVAFFPIRSVEEDIVIEKGKEEVFREPLKLKPTQIFKHQIQGLENSKDIQVKIGKELFYSSDPEANDLKRPIDFHSHEGDTIESLFLQAEQFNKRRNYFAALEKYLELLEKEPLHTRALTRTAELYFRRGEHKKALFYAEKALKNVMYDPEANYIYGIISQRLGRILDAKEALSWASRSMKLRSAAYSKLAEIYMIESRYERALDYSQKSVNSSCSHLNALQMMGAAYRKLERFERAKQILSQILDIDPLNHFARYEAYLLNPGEKNIQNFESLIRCEYREETILELALFYFQIGLEEECVSLFNFISDYPTSCYWLAYVFRDKDPEKSRAYLDKASHLSPYLVFPFREESIKVFQWASEERPQDWKAKYYLSLIFWAKSRTDESRTLLQDCRDPDFVPFYFARGTLFKEQNLDSAQVDFEKAVNLDKNSWRNHFRLVQFYNENKRGERALDAAQKAFDQFPGKVPIRVEYVKALMNKDRFLKASEILENTTALPYEGATDVHQMFAECHIQLALDYMEKGNYEKAVQHLQKSKQYPENLGTGKPYEPDYTRQDELLEECYQKMGKRSEPERKEEPEAMEVPYGTGEWDREKYGNHRAVCEVREKADAVFIHIPWRRRDFNPGKKEVMVIDRITEKRVMNVFRGEINREYGELVFQPVSGPGLYDIYYLVNRMEGRSNYPKVVYPKPEQTASQEWIKRHSLERKNLSNKSFSQAEVLEIQSINEFNSFAPMEVIAAKKEVSQLLENSPDLPYLVFPESREFPIRMKEDLPLRWIQKGLQKTFNAAALKGEYFAFQLGLFAGRKEIKDVEILFNDLIHEDEKSKISASHFTSFNTEGIDWRGDKFDKKVSVKKGEIQPLWCGVQIPEQSSPGIYKGEVILSPKRLQSTSVELEIEVKDQVIKDFGDHEPWRHSRLRWLNSKIALDNDIVFPYIPLKVQDSTIICLGRSVSLDKKGLPESIKSFFAPEMTYIRKKESREILSSPIKLILEDSDQQTFKWKKVDTRITNQQQGVVEWVSSSQAGPVQVSLKGKMEFDGFLGYEVSLAAKKEIQLNDIRLEIPLNKDTAKYMMGMGQKGGFCPDSFQWKWDQKKNQDSLWIGDVNAGLQCRFKDENYSRPLNTNFYQLKPLVIPESWSNKGKGGCEVRTRGKDRLISVFSGKRALKKGETFFFNFELLITPFKVLDTQKHWKNRYYHSFEPVDMIKKKGANVINVHHANEINPFINYPFLTPDEMKNYIDQAHSKGMKVKIYYTVRELSNRAAELFALRSLGDEILSYGPGGGYSWFQEHLVKDYIAGWFVPKLKDAAVINSGVSRWHNYYLEGLDWLTKNVGIDGLYIDDVAFDRIVMKRVRKILERNRLHPLIDLHSANQFNPRDGYANSANLYLEHFPYLDRLWFGEYFDYNETPDFWMVEVSGIPFGLMGEMLQDGGNPWRGMLYGMTSRLPWAGDPTPLWKIWDEFGIEQSRMIGYWTESCPVRTDHKKVLATVYQKADEVMIGLASWAEKDVNVRLEIDWDSVGFQEKSSVLQAPLIKDFQKAALFAPDQKIPVPQTKGWLLLLKKQ
ncbi:MAG: glycoside hydrolase domain-containing protein [Acidobacteriota bacterium]